MLWGGLKLEEKENWAGPITLGSEGGASGDACSHSGSQLPGMKADLVNWVSAPCPAFGLEAL